MLAPRRHVPVLPVAPDAAVLQLLPALPPARAQQKLLVRHVRVGAVVQRLDVVLRRAQARQLVVAVPGVQIRARRVAAAVPARVRTAEPAHAPGALVLAVQLAGAGRLRRRPGWPGRAGAAEEALARPRPVAVVVVVESPRGSRRPRWPRRVADARGGPPETRGPGPLCPSSPSVSALCVPVPLLYFSACLLLYVAPCPRLYPSCPSPAPLPCLPLCPCLLLSLPSLSLSPSLFTSSLSPSLPVSISLYLPSLSPSASLSLPPLCPSLSPSLSVSSPSTFPLHPFFVVSFSTLSLSASLSRSVSILLHLIP